MKSRRTCTAFLCCDLVLIAASFLGGCAAIHPDRPSASVNYGAVGTSIGAFPQAPAPAARDEELWIIEQPPEPAVPTFTIPSVGEVPVGAGLLLDVRGLNFTPLKLQRSDISAEIDGASASVDVRQRFINPSADTIEAAYAFPLPRNAAVNEFVITIGSRHIRGIVREAAEARKIYDEARAMGFLSSLIVQKSPGVFVQRIANLSPGRAIDIEMRYIHAVWFRDGAFDFVCPMTIRPTDGSAAAANRNGRDVSLSVQLNAGITIDRIESPSHKITIKSQTESTAHIELEPADEIANADFHLRYALSARSIENMLTIERDGADGTFALLVLRPATDTTHRAAGGLAIEWHGANVTDVFPKPGFDLKPGHPVLLMGRYHGTPPSTVTLGDRSSVARPVALGGRQPLGSMWARRKIANLSSDTAQPTDSKLAEQVRNVAMEYGLESSYTSFIVVDATTRLSTGDARR